MKFNLLFTISMALAGFPAGILANNPDSNDSDCHIWIKDNSDIVVGYSKAVTGQTAVVEISEGPHKKEQFKFATAADQTNKKDCTAGLAGERSFPAGWRIKTFKTEPWLTFTRNYQPIAFKGYNRDPQTQSGPLKFFEIPYGEMKSGRDWYVPPGPTRESQRYRIKGKAPMPNA